MRSTRGGCARSSVTSSRVPAARTSSSRSASPPAALAFAGELPPPRPELRRRVLVEGVVLPFRRRALPFVSAAAVAAACAAVGFALHAAIGDSTPARGSAHTYPLHGPEGALIVAPSGEAVLVVRRLRAAPARMTYEVWVVRGRPPDPGRHPPRLDGRADAAGPAGSRGRGHARARGRLAESDRTVSSEGGDGVGSWPS